MTVLLMSVALSGFLLAALAAITFVGLLYQPDLVWIASGLTMLAAFVGLVLIPADRHRAATFLVWVAPGAYSLPWVGRIAFEHLRPDSKYAHLIVNSSPNWETEAKILIWMLVLHLVGVLLLHFHRQVAIVFHQKT